MKISRHMTAEQRFWCRVQKSDGCWLWTGKPDKDGYGHLRGWHGRQIGAHRFSFELHNGEINDSGLMVCHTCDNPPCVRPDHLFLGTCFDNIQDCIRKGRNACGDRNASRLYPERRPRGDKHHWQTKPETRMVGRRNGRAKLTDAAVREIRRLWLTGRYAKTELGRMFDVTDVVIFNVINLRSWKHIVMSVEELEREEQEEGRKKDGTV